MAPRRRAPTSDDARLTLGPWRPGPSTWALLPSEAAKRPSLCLVTTASGSLLATIDPTTRERRTAGSGALEAVLSPQGWQMDLRQTTGVAFAPRAPLTPDYAPTLREDRDPRR